MTYPDGRELNYNYNVGLNDRISRLSPLTEGLVTLEALKYLGAATVIRRAHPQANVDSTYIKQANELNGVAGDQYAGLDQFGRVVDQGVTSAA